MKISLGSAFRNNAGAYLNRYFRQVSRLQDVLERRGDELHLALVWGDCVDQTPDELNTYASSLGVAGYRIVERSHGGPVYPSSEAIERMRALSRVGNGILETTAPGTDTLIYVESDLLWIPETMLRLIDRLGPEVDVVAPLIYAGVPFYDIWAFRSLAGERYGPFHPYNRDLRHDGELTEVSSVGSCLIMKGSVAAECRIVEDGEGDLALVGFCRNVRKTGYRVWVDANERVEHPS